MNDTQHTELIFDSNRTPVPAQCGCELHTSVTLLLCPLHAAATELLNACEDMVWLDKRKGETENDLFERVATRFKSDTGMLSPGKSQAAALCGTPTMDERKAKHEKWYAGFYDRARAAIAKAKPLSAGVPAESGFAGHQ